MRGRGAVALVLAVVAALVLASPAQGDPGVGWVVESGSLHQEAALIGAGSVNETGRRFGVEGTDLGHAFVVGARMAMVFGDTFGAPVRDDFFAVPHEDWRSNVLGWVDPTASPAGGLRITDMVTDRDGHASELLGSRKRPGTEQTVIPTYGIAVGSRSYLHWMSVRRFEEPGHWSLTGAGVATSDDGGRTWAKGAPLWPADSRFGQVAFVRPGGADDPDAPGDPDTVYAYGIPGGRYGGLSLARVPADRVADPAAWRYWTGSGWATTESAAATVVAGPVGELSVRWNSYYRTWLMTYLVDPTGEVVMRTAPSATGPWSDPQVVLTTRDFPAAYAPYLLPRWADGPDLWFTLSRFGPYRTYLMRVRLTPQPAGAPLPRDLVPTVPGPVPVGPRSVLPHEHGL